MKEDIYHSRTKLLLTFTEKKYSQSAKHDTMLLFGILKPEQKEEVAKAAIPLVKSSKTEEEALQKIKELINEKAV